MRCPLPSTGEAGVKFGSGLTGRISDDEPMRCGTSLGSVARLQAFRSHGAVMTPGAVWETGSQLGPRG